jgi:preprotein translocase subunit SecG
MTHIWTDVTSIIFAFTGILLIFIILLQRGRGGGLAGAFGATGGQSAFGTKAGDVFTRITIGIAVVWVALAGLTSWAMVSERSAVRYHQEGGGNVESLPGKAQEEAPKNTEKPQKADDKSGNAGQPKPTGTPADTPQGSSGTSPKSPGTPPATK